jgi:hypothetical protein
MPISNLDLNQNNLNRNGVFNASTQSAPYNQLFHNIGSTSLKGKKVALQKASLYRSWASISSDNNTFQISFPTGTTTYTDVNVVIPVNRNFETIDELDNFLKTVMIANKMYLINNTTGDYLYWMSFVANPTAYGVSLIQALVPTSLPTGYTAPSGFIGYPTASRTMKLTTDASKFNLLIGYQASTTFSGGATAKTFDSTFCPQLNPVSSFRISINIANNPLALNNDSTIIYTDTSAGVDWGSIIEIEPNNLVWYDITTDSNLVIVSITDQNGYPLNIRDPQIDVLLLIDSGL